MPQLHLYLPEEIAKRVRAKASSRSVSVSRYLSDLVRREMGEDWPPGFWDQVVGGWAGETITRPPQGEFEPREPI